jgi:hypothetical protein
MVGTWTEFGLIAPIAFGNALVRKCGSVRSPNTDRSIFISIDVNKIADDAIRISRKVCKRLILHHHCQQTFGSAQNDQIDPT